MTEIKKKGDTSVDSVSTKKEENKVDDTDNSDEVDIKDKIKQANSDENKKDESSDKDDNNSNKKNNKESKIQRQPAIFVNHGGGPMPLIDYNKSDNSKDNVYTGTQQFIIDSCLEIGNLIKKNKPSAILIFSAVKCTHALIYQTSMIIVSK